MFFKVSTNSELQNSKINYYYYKLVLLDYPPLRLQLDHHYVSVTKILG